MMKPIFLVATIIALLPSAAYAKELDPAAQLGIAINDNCVGVNAFLSHTSKEFEMWSVQCSDGRTFLVTIFNDRSTRVQTCAEFKLNWKRDCFVKLD